MKLYRLFLYYKEWLWPSVMATVAAFLFFKYNAKIKDVDTFIDKLLNTSLSVSGTLLGFLLTILTIINGVSTRRMQFIKTGGGFPRLNKFLKLALWSDLFCISVFFIFPLINSQVDISKHKQEIYPAIVWTVCYTWFLNIRFSVLFIESLMEK